MTNVRYFVDEREVAMIEYLTFMGAQSMLYGNAWTRRQHDERGRIEWRAVSAKRVALAVG